MQLKVLMPAFLILTLLAAGCQGMEIPVLIMTPTVAPTPPPTPTRADEQVIPFTTLAVNFVNTTTNPPPALVEPQIVTEFPYQWIEEDLEKSLEPQVFLVTASEAVEPFQHWLPPETLAALAEVDYDQYFVIAFFIGRSGGGDGYIDRIAVDSSGAINVYGVRRQYSSGVPVHMLPSHIVQIRRDDVPILVDASVPVNLETRVDLILP
jgi:hypothetical protein